MPCDGGRVRAFRRWVLCAIGAHRWVAWWVFVSPTRPRYEWRIECLFCGVRLW